jgi:hypothetical protein
MYLFFGLSHGNDGEFGGNGLAHIDENNKQQNSQNCEWFKNYF